ncbi:hypothetical protein DL767_009766 [Monosporascus sp. MG133]|nr:hypothetical protein DL767_009766 [Monosporascus sp. MG133]
MGLPADRHREQMTYENDDDPRLGNRRVLIAFGSETGNSQNSAEDLGRLAERLHFRTWVCEMNEIELNTLLHYPLVIFVVSTTGQGEVPKNARKFWKSLLRKRLPPNCLSAVNFTTFGLGDSSYSKYAIYFSFVIAVYNWAARKLHKRLEQLGAAEFYPRGEADERHDDGIDGAFLPWSTSLRTHLLTNYPLPQGLSPIPLDVRLPPKFTIEIALNAEGADAKMPGPYSTPDMDSSSSAGSAKPTDGRRGESDIRATSALGHSDHDQLSLDRTAAQFSHVDIADPGALEAELQYERTHHSNYAVSARLSEGAARVISGGIDNLDRPNVLRDDASKYSLHDNGQVDDSVPPPDLLPIPGSFSAVRDPQTKERIEPFYKPGDVLTIYPKNFPEDVQALIDLMGWGEVADQPFEHHSRQGGGIPGIAWHTDDPMHMERLREFADPKYTDEFYDYTSRPRRSILEILQDFPSVKIPYQEIPSIFPVIRGREYSIASGGDLLKEKGTDDLRAELLVALVKYKTVLRKTRQGLCSRYIASLKPDTTINIMIGDNQGPPNESRHIRAPLLAIGPGTGVAPIRSLIHDRLSYPVCGENVLIFGGRNRKADFYFSNEWKDLGVTVHTAFSRDQKEKIYVQDVIRQQAGLICYLVQKGAIMCLCGSSGKMPEAVRQALYDALVIGGLAPNAEAAKHIFNNRVEYWEEVW